MIASAQALMNGDSTRRLHTLKITAVRCHLLTADFTENALTALTSSIRYWTTALAEIETDEGLSGLGEFLDVKVKTRIRESCDVQCIFLSKEEIFDIIFACQNQKIKRI